MKYLEGAKILPASGEKVNLSNKELNYRVTAENGDIQEYKHSRYGRN